MVTRQMLFAVRQSTTNVAEAIQQQRDMRNDATIRQWNADVRTLCDVAEAALDAREALRLALGFETDMTIAEANPLLRTLLSHLPSSAAATEGETP